MGMDLKERVFSIVFARVAFYAATNLMLFVAGAVMLWLGLRAAMAAGTTDATAFLAAGLVLLFAATISRFESLKGLGVEAKINQQISEADARLKQVVKQSTEMFAAQIVELSSASGRWDSAPAPRAAYDNAQKIKAMLEQGGSDVATIKRVLEPWVRVTSLDLAADIIGELDKLIQDELQRRKSSLSQISPLAELGEAAARRSELNGEIKVLENYRGQMKKELSDFSGGEFAHRLVPLLEQAPPLATNVDHLIKRAVELKGALLELSDTMTLKNPHILTSRQ